MPAIQIQPGSMPTASSAAACFPPSQIMVKTQDIKETPSASFLLPARPKLTLQEAFSADRVLYSCYQAFKGKNYRPRYYAFNLDLGLNLHRLCADILHGTYKPDRPSVFTIFCNCGQKNRTIHASSVRDVVAQRIIYDYLYPEFNRSFIFDNYGCRLGKGTRKAADRVQEFIRRSPKDSYYLQLDVRKFYYNIDHAVLRELLGKKVKDPALLDLCMSFATHDPGPESYTPYDPNVGLNVGAMISQLYGLIYLDYIDHYIKDELGVKFYVRYVDDMVLIGLTKQECLELKAKIEQRLWDKLHLKLSVAIIQPLRHGINFAGFITRARSRYVRKFSQRNFNRKLKKGPRKAKSIQAHLAHARHTASFGRMAARLISTCPELVSHLTGRMQYDLLKLVPRNPGPNGHRARLPLQPTAA